MTCWLFRKHLDKKAGYYGPAVGWTWSKMYLYLGQDADGGDDDTEYEVEADEDLVLCAVIRFSVVNEKKHHSGNGQCIVE